MAWKTFKPRRTQKRRTHYKYTFIKNRKIKHKGITKDLEEREKQHRSKFRGGHIKQVGRKTTEEAARDWEKKQGVS